MSAQSFHFASRKAANVVEDASSCVTSNRKSLFSYFAGCTPTDCEENIPLPPNGHQVALLVMVRYEAKNFDRDLSSNRGPICLEHC